MNKNFNCNYYLNLADCFLDIYSIMDVAIAFIILIYSMIQIECVIFCLCLARINFYLASIESNLNLYLTCNKKTIRKYNLNLKFRIILINKIFTFLVLL